MRALHRLPALRQACREGGRWLAQPAPPLGTCSFRGYSFGRGASDSANQRSTWQRRVSQLQRSFDSERSPQRLAELLRALNHIDPHRVIQIFEQQEPRAAISNAGALREYVRALVLADRLDYVDLGQLVPRLGAFNSEVALGRPAQDYAAGTSAGGGATASAAMAAAAAAAGGSMEIRLSDQQPLKVTIADSHRRSFWRLLRSSIAMLIVVAGVTVIAEGLAGNMQKGLGMSGKKIVPVEDTNTTFDDVMGCDEVKDELREIILYLKDPDRFTRLGAKLPKGVMMAGQPGTGKTLLARAIAGEAGVPFLQASGSDFEEMFVGVGARRIRDLFGEARKHAPCIVFIDEIDAVGSKRSSRDNNAVRMTLNQLLVELDGFEQNSGIVVICATNFAESLDKALTRPGRLDKIIHVPIPDLKGRTQILEMYASKLVLDAGVEMTTLARRTAGMTGADLANILNIAAIRSSAEGLAAVPVKFLEEAFDRVVVGLERRNPMSDEEKKLTAYHEGGHTLVSLGTNGTEPIHKATIMPRGGALGITWSIPEGEKFSQRLFELQAQLEVLMGGKAAEELIFGPENVTSGCTSDLRQATGLARRMVLTFGMAGEFSPAPISVDMDEYAVLSDDAKNDIDQKTQELLTNSYNKAAKYLRAHETELHLLAAALIEFETLDANEIRLAIAGSSEKIAELRKEAAERDAKHLEGIRSKEPPAPALKKVKKGAAAKARAPEKQPEPEYEEE